MDLNFYLWISVPNLENEELNEPTKEEVEYRETGENLS